MKEKKEVTKEFHLPLEEATKLFEGYEKPRRDNIAVVAMNPINTSGLYVDKTTDEAKRKQLAKKGFLVIGVGSMAKDVKVGDIIGAGFIHGEDIKFALKKDINVKDVFPMKRTYTLMILSEFLFTHFITAKQELETEIKEVAIKSN